MAKRRTHLEQRLARLKHWAQSTGKREAQASRRRERLRKAYTNRSKELYLELGAYQRTLEEQDMAEHVVRRVIKEHKAIADAELEQLRAKECRAYEQCNTEFRKQERYCKEQRDVLRTLEELKAHEKTMYELDHRKDQVMTVCKVALANLAMWVRDHYFPAYYAQATWRRLLPFFHLSGTITHDPNMVQVELRLSTIACSIETWRSFVNASIRRCLDSPMDASSRSLFARPVAFLLHRGWPE